MVEEYKKYSKGTRLADNIRYSIQAAVNKHHNTVNETVHIYDNLVNELNGPLKVMVAGEFNTGKSTFINAILGRELLKSDVVPTTAVVTYLCYSPQEYLYVVLKNGQGAKYPLEDLKELTSENTKKFFSIRDQISSVYVYINVSFLRSICIIDSPGVNVMIGRHEDNTHSIIEEVDCVIWVMSVLHAGQKSEIAEINKLSQNLKPFIILNKLDLLDPDDVDVNDAINRMGRNISNYCTGYVAVSAYQALCACQQNNKNLFYESRFEEFLKILKSNYADERENIIYEKVKEKIDERRAVIAKIPEDKNQEVVKKTYKWLCNHRNIQKAVILKELSIYYKTENQREFSSNVKTKDEMNMSISQVVYGLNNLTVELTKCLEIRKNKYSVKSLLDYVYKQINDCHYFSNAYSIYSDDQIDWMYIKENLQVLYSNYKKINNFVDKQVNTILMDDNEDIEQWQEKMNQYKTALGYEIERDILSNI